MSACREPRRNLSNCHDKLAEFRQREKENQPQRSGAATETLSSVELEPKQIPAADRAAAASTPASVETAEKKAASVQSCTDVQRPTVKPAHADASVQSPKPLTATPPESAPAPKPHQPQRPAADSVLPSKSILIAQRKGKR